LLEFIEVDQPMNVIISPIREKFWISSTIVGRHHPSQAPGTRVRLVPKASQGRPVQGIAERAALATSMPGKNIPMDILSPIRYL